MAAVSAMRLYWAEMPMSTSALVNRKINNPDFDYLKEPYCATSLIANGTREEDLTDIRATLAKKSQNVGAARLHLMTEARNHELGDGTQGISKSSITCYYTKVKHPLDSLEVDHFHPANLIKDFLDKVDDLLKNKPKEAGDFIKRLKEMYPEGAEITWKHFVKVEEGVDGKEYFKLRTAYRVLQHNQSENLWFVINKLNASWGDRVKIPEDGQNFEDSIIGSCKFYGGDFLSMLGKINPRTHKFVASKKINKSGPTYLTSIFFNPKTGAASKTERLYGLGLLARNWFAYRYHCLNTPQKAIAPVRDAVDQFSNTLKDCFLTIEESEEADKLSGEQAKALRAKAIAETRQGMKLLLKQLKELELFPLKN